jgi:hypothetical protein
MKMRGLLTSAAMPLTFVLSVRAMAVCWSLSQLFIAPIVVAMLAGPLGSQPAHAVPTLATIGDAINALDPLHPTVTENAYAAPGVLLPVGTNIVWTYLVSNDGSTPITISIRDDAGMPAILADDSTLAMVKTTCSILVKRGYIRLQASSLRQPSLDSIRTWLI